MDQTKEEKRVQRCPQCGNHCPVDDLQCKKGRRFFGLNDQKSDAAKHDKKHRRAGNGLSKQLRRCGRFVKHAELEEDELFQALTDVEKTTLQVILDKLSADWQARFGEERRKNGHHHHHKHK